MNSKDRLRNRQMQPPRNMALAVPQQNILISTVPHLLENNFPPTEDEIQKIQEIISVAKDEENRLKTFARSIPRYTNSTQDAIYRESQKLRQNVQDFIHKHERLLSPLFSLPTEILALIFTHSLPNLETTWNNQRPTWKNRPLDSFRLSQVCQRWRIIALDTPQLWAILGSVDLSVPRISPPRPSSASNIENHHQKLKLKDKHPNAYVEFLQEILDRSKAEGLCLWLYTSLGPAYKTLGNPFVDLLAKQAHRIVTLQMVLSPATVIAFCAACDTLRSDSCSITFPRLRRLVLNLEAFPMGSTIDGFAHTPALRDVTVTGAHSFRLSLPWSQLHTYSEAAEIWGHSRGNLEAVLSSAKNLERLDVAHLQYDIFPPSFDTTDIAKKVAPAKISHVRLDFSQKNRHEQRIIALLMLFHYPAVQTLRIEPSAYDVLGIFLTVANDHYQHLSTPFINLTKFYHRSKVSHASTFISFLRLCPNLEELNIELPSPMALATLISTYYSPTSTSHDVLLPALKRLFIHTNFLQLSFRDTDQMFILLRDATDILRNNLNRSPSLHVQLIFEDNDMPFLRKAQAYLNNGVDYSNQLPNHMPLSQWCRSLHEVIPPLKLPRIPRRGSGTHKFRFAGIRLNSILACIEKHDLKAYELRKLYNSQLHLTLCRLALFPADLLPGDTTHKFRARARGILKKWEPLHSADLRSANTLTLWALKGIRTLVFIPLNNPLRTGPDAMKLIYGLDDD